MENILNTVLVVVIALLLLDRFKPKASRLVYWVKAKLGNSRKDYLENRVNLLLAEQKAVELRVKAGLDSIKQDTAAISELNARLASGVDMTPTYVEALANLTKADGAIIERLQKQEDLLVSIVAALNRLTV